MKIKSIIIAIFFIFSSLAFAENYIVPNGWQQKENFITGSAKLYKKNNDNFFVVAVNMEKARIKLGSYSQHITYNNKDFFYNDSLENYWYNNQDYADIYNGTYQNLFAVLNGQFFNHKRNPSQLSFPVKSSRNILTDNNGEEHRAKRSLLINSNGKAYIREGVSTSLLNSPHIKEFITGFHPDEGINSLAWFVGRHFIGGIPEENCNPETASCSYKYILFFINQDATQRTMKSEIAKWGVPKKSIIMMDGSGSAQMKTLNYSVYGSNGQGIDKRYLPSAILIYGI